MGAFRVLSGAVVGVGVVVALVGCEPGAGLSTGAVAFTTDQTATRELEKQGLDVRWLTCTASYDDSKNSDDKQAGNKSSPSAHTVANVDCTGEDKKGREIKVTGKVTKEVSGKCVRGDLTAKVDGKEWFRVDVLGNCNAPDATPTPNSPVTDQPNQPGPTVTVTQTIWCQRDPECWPEGK
ncbi:hypothetical protein [Streptomyces graminofaciens]|nr:hypothetical protein [Streptomyces graminofaciens]